MCVRHSEGHENRGGYFFHLVPTMPDCQHVSLYNFEKILVAEMTLQEATRLINHCSGLEFSDWAFQFCQAVRMKKPVLRHNL